MRNFLSWLDNLGGIETENQFAGRLERIVFIFLILMVLSAPHSIAATQTAWLSGMLFWTIRFLVKPRPKLVRTPLGVPLLVFFIWSVISVVFSYAPDISASKLRNVALFLIFYFVVNNLRNIRAVKFLAFTLISSCLISAAWSPIQRFIGRGVQISGVSNASPLAKGLNFNHDVYLKARGKNLKSFDDDETAAVKAMPLVDDDAIVEVEGKKISTPEELTAEIEKNDTTFLECFRTPEYFTVKIRRADLLEGATALEKLGIGGWKPNRNWRYTGFYGQIITYAEVLQLIASLAFGLFVALITNHGFFAQRFAATEKLNSKNQKPPNEIGKLILLVASLGLIVFALLTTFTRSAEIAFLISACSIVLANGHRKMLFALAAVILPIALVGLFIMQQSRKVDFYDKNEASVNYRQTVYREGFDLWTQNPRHFFLGVGMDSVKRYKGEWHLFDNGKLETSHFHSTPLQLLVERGLPALLLWLLILGIYAKTLLENLRVKIQRPKSADWQTDGILLGCFGGLTGFFVSSLVNYSLGDGEVAMVFYLLTGIGVSLCSAKSKMQK